MQATSEVFVPTPARDRTYILSRVINRYYFLFNMIPNVLQERRATAPSVVGFQRLDRFAKCKTITYVYPNFHEANISNNISFRKLARLKQFRAFRTYFSPLYCKHYRLSGLEQWNWVECFYKKDQGAIQGWRDRLHVHTA